MAEKKAFLLRLDPVVWDEMERLAQSELRSVNAQIEFLLRDALAQRGIKPKGTPARAPSSSSSSPSTSSSSRGSRVD
ncbi:MAG TPA: hypothetical protein VN989_08650 [Casimicrobiaceae bacterium]|nr:hypothetical protein [Casimicrobiaceae bacterium]